MNLAAPLTRMYGAMLGKPGRRKGAVADDLGTGAAASFMDDLHCNLDLRDDLNSERGKSRKARAIGMS
jgi:hypothetical protein